MCMRVEAEVKPPVLSQRARDLRWQGRRAVQQHVAKSPRCHCARDRAAAGSDARAYLSDGACPEGFKGTQVSDGRLSQRGRDQGPAAGGGAGANHLLLWHCLILTAAFLTALLVRHAALGGRM